MGSLETLCHQSVIRLTAIPWWQCSPAYKDFYQNALRALLGPQTQKSGPTCSFWLDSYWSHKVGPGLEQLLKTQLRRGATDSTPCLCLGCLALSAILVLVGFPSIICSCWLLSSGSFLGPKAMLSSLLIATSVLESLTTITPHNSPEQQFCAQVHGSCYLETGLSK